MYLSGPGPSSLPIEPNLLYFEKPLYTRSHIAGALLYFDANDELVSYAAGPGD